MSYPIIRIKSKLGKYEEFPLVKDEISVGRSVTCDITIEDASVSRVHFRLLRQGTDYMIVDNGSSNGTYLQKRKVKQELLQNGDDIFAGRVHIYFSNKQVQEPSNLDPGMETVDLHPDELMETAAYQAMSPQANLQNTPAMEAPTPPGGMPLRYPPSGPPLEPPSGPPSGPHSAGSQATPERPTTPIPPPVMAPPMPVAPAMAPPPQAAPPMAPPFGAPPSGAPPSYAAPPAPAFDQMQQGFQDDDEGFASPIHRLLAVIIDGFLGCLLTVPIIVLPFMGVKSPAVSGTLMGLIFLILFLHPVIGWLKFGKTLGKHFLGLRIVMVDDPQRRGLTFKAFLMRLIGYMISGMLMYLPFITILTDSEGRGFHDKMAGTQVVKKV